MSKTVYILGGFPPPVTGAAKNNSLFAKDMSDRGFVVRKLNTSGPTISHARGRGYHLSRAFVNLKAAAGVLFGGTGPIYIVPDGGLGVMYTTIHCIFSRIRLRRIILHHRTFRYIDNFNIFINLINKICGNKSVNVFLSDGMKNKFTKQYGSKNNMVVGNSHYVELSELNTGLKQKYSIGHLSNLCHEKGFFDVCDLFERLAGQLDNIQLHLAGPVIETEVQKRIDHLVSIFGNRIQYYGPLYGEDKQLFYNRCRFFIFPTRYPLEAAPNVVYEALAAGCVVIATTNGCIPEMLSGVRGRSVPINQFVDTAFDAVVSALASDNLHNRAVEIRDDLRKEIVEDKLRYERLVAVLASSEEKFYL